MEMIIFALLFISATVYWWFFARDVVSAWIRKQMGLDDLDIAFDEEDFKPGPSDKECRPSQVADPERPPSRCQAQTKAGTQCKRMGTPSWGGFCLQHARMALEQELDDPDTPKNEALERLREYLDND